MTKQEEVLKIIEECNKDRVKTLAEFIALVFKDKFIEMYLGDSYEELSVDQVSTSYPAVFCGKVFAAYKECLVVNSVYVDSATKKMKLGNLMFISERAIRGLNEIDGNGIIEDMFLRSKESLDIKSQFIDMMPARIFNKTFNKK